MTRREIISAHKVNNFMFCPHSYHLDKQIPAEIQKSLPITALTAVLFWLDNAFYGTKSGLIRPEDTNSEHITLADHIRYKSPDSFANFEFGLWKKWVIDENGFVRNRPVVWDYKNQWWKAADVIKNACRNYYQFILENGLPNIPTLEINEEDVFSFNNRKYAVNLGELRKDMRIDDFGLRKINPNQSDKDWKITLKILAFCTLTKESEVHRSKLGLEELAKELESENKYVSNNVTYVYHDLARSETYQTTRTDSDVNIMIKEIQQTWTAIISSYKQKRFVPNHNNCDVCKYNVKYNGEVVCKERNPNKLLLMPQEYFKNNKTKN